MKKILSLTFLAFFVIFIASCAAENENIANLPKIDGFEVKKIFRLNRNLLAVIHGFIRKQFGVSS